MQKTIYTGICTIQFYKAHFPYDPKGTSLRVRVTTYKTQASVTRNKSSEKIKHFVLVSSLGRVVRAHLDTVPRGNTKHSVANLLPRTSLHASDDSIRALVNPNRK